MPRRAFVLGICLIVAGAAGSATVHGWLPERVPTHWDLSGRADGYGPRSVATALMPLVMTMMLGMCCGLPAVSPSQFKLDEFRSTYGFIVVVAMAMMTLIHAVTLIGAMGSRIDVSRVLVAGAMLGLGLMGNVMGKVRRNFFVRFRVPWTLASERVWNETHRLGAWVTCGGGLFGSVLASLGHPLVALGLLVPIVLVPVAYSLVRYKQLEQLGEL